MSLLTRRRALMLAKEKVLPYAYQQVEYLECSGTQWIDTGFYLTSEDDIEFQISSENFKTNGKSATIFSSNDTGIDPNWHYSCNFGTSLDDRTVYLWKYYATTYGYITRAYGMFEYYKPIVRTNGNKWDISKGIGDNFTNNLYVESNGKNLWISGKVSPIPLILFAAWSSTDNIMKPHQSTPLRMHYFKVINNNEIIAEFIPCYRKADCKTGMYDIINNKFCRNNGTGEFVLGNKIIN